MESTVLGVIIIVSLELLPAALVDLPTIIITIIAFLVMAVLTESQRLAAIWDAQLAILRQASHSR